MIPHHSSAILMANKIKQKTSNKNIIKLADNIISSQTCEIKYMNDLLSQDDI